MYIKQTSHIDPNNWWLCKVTDKGFVRSVCSPSMRTSEKVRFIGSILPWHMIISMSDAKDFRNIYEVLTDEEAFLYMI